MVSSKQKVSMIGIVLQAMIKLLVYFLIIVIFYYGITNAFSFGHSIFEDSAVSAPPGIDKTVVLEKDISTLDAGELLEQMGLISDKMVFAVQSVFYGFTIYPGTYTLNTSMTSKDILMMVSQAPEETEPVTTAPETDAQEETIPEGEADSDGSE